MRQVGYLQKLYRDVRSTEHKIENEYLYSKKGDFLTLNLLAPTTVGARINP